MPARATAAAIPTAHPPPYLDWDLWLGPLRWRPYNSRYLHGVFRWFLESGGGQIRDRGAHVMSVAKYVMQADDAGPVTVEATGTAPTKGLWDTAVDMQVVYTFKNPDWVLTWNQPGKPVPMENGKTHGYGAVYHGGQGRPGDLGRRRRHQHREEGPRVARPPPARRKSTAARATRRIGSTASAPAQRRS